MEAARIGCFTLLMADDDADDRFLTEQACLEIRSCGALRFVEDGEELMHYLRRQGKYADPANSPRPGLILLDLNMPKKDGRQALVEIKADPDLRSIPVAIWTTSEEKDDRIQSLKAGADDYATKPSGYAELVNNIKRLVERYTSQEPTDGKM
jgi:DNA-binding response OmpR family regulator